MANKNFNINEIENKIRHQVSAFPELTYIQYRAAMFYALGGKLKILAEDNNTQTAQERQALYRARDALYCKNLDDLRSLVLLRLLFF